MHALGFSAMKALQALLTRFLGHERCKQPVQITLQEDCGGPHRIRARRIAPMNEHAKNDLATLRLVAEDPLVAPSRRVRARKALKVIEARAENGSDEMTRAEIFDLIAAAEGSIR